MSDVILKWSGDTTILPKGVEVSTPVSLKKKINTAEMIDGSRRHGFLENSTEMNWQLSWKPKLSYGDITTLKFLSSLNEKLEFQNQYESMDWFYVLVASFSYDSVMVAGEEKYWARMELREA